MWIRRLLLLLAVLAAAVLVSFWVRAAMSHGASPPGSADGRLPPCPDSPNCVSSRAADPEHRVEPLRFTGDPATAIGRLAEVVGAMPRAEVVTVDGPYLHAEHTSLLFRFVDDLEALADPREGVIHLRSASRVGHSDLGANRRRVEELRRRWREASDGAS